MKAPKSHLSHLAPHAEAMLHGKTANQFGAICLREGSDGMLQVLLITTRETRRWTVPKGWPIDGLRPHEVAEREAWEEAGIKGKAEKAPYGYYTYLKKSDDNRAIVSMVEVHLLDVRKACPKFPERRERSLNWLTPAEASLHVLEPELKSLLAGLEAKLKPRRHRSTGGLIRHETESRRPS